jgi:hypothetical protein
MAMRKFVTILGAFAKLGKAILASLSVYVYLSVRRSVGLFTSNKITGPLKNLSMFIIFFYGATATTGPGPPHFRGFTITLRHTTIGRTLWTSDHPRLRLRVHWDRHVYHNFYLNYSPNENTFK